MNSFQTTLFLLVSAIILVLIIVFTCRSATPNTSGFKSSFGAETTKTSDISSKIDSITPDTVLIFYAPWCGHCKSSMKDFMEASGSSNGKVMMINSDDSDPKVRALIKTYEIRGFPTIKKANGTIHTGQRTAAEIKKFAESK